MKINWNWLNQIVCLPVDVWQAADKLTQLGLEVASVSPVCAHFSGVVVAQIKAMERHPDADHLQVCQIDAGHDECLSIVCGAGNIREGMKIACATVGGRLPKTDVATATLHGVASQGMLCSAAELGLAATSSGVLVLPDDAQIGQKLSDLLATDDYIIDMDLTPNRGDCFSVLGIARELAAIYSCAQPQINFDFNPTTEKTHQPRSDAMEACPRFATCVIEEIDANATTPVWMSERLRRCGIHTLHPAVDVTNYVMLEIGQPLHAYDSDCIDGQLHARWGRCNEELTLLNGTTVALDDRTLVIADNQGALGLAAVMGGQSSAVGERTKTIILESAWFNPQAIAGRARKYGLHTDASLRFERGVDYGLQVRALRRAASLLNQIAGGRSGDIVMSDHAASLPNSIGVDMSRKKLQRYLGRADDGHAFQRWFRSCGFTVDSSADGWNIKPPSWRFDIAIEEDLIEEVARFQGYHEMADRIEPEKQVEASPAIREGVRTQLDVKKALVNLGFCEAITYSFVDDRKQRLLFPHDDPIKLLNPLSHEMDVMRLSLIPGLLLAVLHNQNRQQQSIMLFEEGLTFERGDDANVVQKKCLGLSCFGIRTPYHWLSSGDTFDFYTLKGVVEHLLTAANLPLEWHNADLPQWAHSGQSAWISAGEKRIGIVAVLDPRVARCFGIDLPGAVAEITFDALLPIAKNQWSPTSRQPPTYRDLSLVVDESVSAAHLIRLVRECNMEWLSDCRVFDVYRGAGIDAGKKSLALHFVWQAPEITPTDKQIDDRMNEVFLKLQQDLSVSMR